MLAVVTGANSGMGFEICRAVAAKGYDVIMACYDMDKAYEASARLKKEFPDVEFDARFINLADLKTVAEFASALVKEKRHIDLLMNNAGSLQDERRITTDGLEYNVSVNYVGPYLLTRMLLPLMGRGTRIVNMASLMYQFGRLPLEEFFTAGCKGSYNRFSVYGQTKLAITLFTLELASRVKELGITVNASDPWIVSTNIIRMNNKVVDWLCDTFFRPVIYTPAKGASTAIDLLLNPAKAEQTGTFNKNCHPVHLPDRVQNHVYKFRLWYDTEKIIESIFQGYGLANPLA